ncbi:hypothetical protein D9M70_78530 [compost metagenome]
MLGLGEQVHGDPVRIGLAVAHHQDLGGTGDHVDSDLAKHVALGSGDIDVARADHFIDLRHAFGAVSQCGNGLSATDGEHTIDAGDAGSGQHQFIDFTARGRHDHDHFGDAGDLGRNRVHQHRRRVRRLATRYVQAGTVQRRDFLAQHGAVGLGVAPGVLLLFFVIAAHTGGGDFQRFALSHGNARQCQFQTLTRQDQVGHGLHVQAVELAGKVHQCRVATLTHSLDDVQHPLIDRVVRHTFPAQQMIQMMREIRVSSVESANCSRCGHSESLIGMAKTQAP